VPGLEFGHFERVTQERDPTILAVCHYGRVTLQRDRNATILAVCHYGRVTLQRDRNADTPKADLINVASRYHPVDLIEIIYS
jgi:hypothetical protein